MLKRHENSIFLGTPMQDGSRLRLSAGWSTEASPSREGGSPLSSGHRGTKCLTPWHHHPHQATAPAWQGPFLSSGVHRSWQKTKNILVVGKCLLSTFDAPDTARNAGCDSEDRRHSRLNAAPESPGPGVLAGFLEARPPLLRLETLSWCDHSFSELSTDGVLRAFQSPGDAGKM